MDRYHIALFFHLLALLIAVAVTAVTKIAEGRRARARTVGEALEWHNTLVSSAKLFPLCLAIFVATGFYMLGISHVAPFDTGFVLAGLVGVVFLLASGIFLAMKGKALSAVLEGMAQKGADNPAPKLVPSAIVAILPTANTGVALSVAFDMVTKPTSSAVALSIVAVGFGLGAVMGMRRPAPAAEKAPAA
jgi:hypothetical protein